MTVPVQDVLSGGEPEQAPGPSRTRVPAIAVAAILAATLVALLAQRDTSPEVPGTVELTGSILLDDITSRRVELPSGAVQERAGAAFGPVRLELPDRDLVGRAIFTYDADISGAEPDYALHTWGDALLELGGTTCHGTFAWSNLEQPLEGGGALQARCEDGATLAGRLAATPQSGQDLVIDVRDGWYRPGGHE